MIFNHPSPDTLIAIGLNYKYAIAICRFDNGKLVSVMHEASKTEILSEISSDDLIEILREYNAPSAEPTDIFSSKFD